MRSTDASKNTTYKTDLFKMIPSLNAIDNFDQKGEEVETTLYEDEDEEGDFGMSEDEDEFDDEEGEVEDMEEGEFDEDFEDDEDEEEEVPAKK